MVVKQNPSKKKKEGEITRSERTSATNQAESVLKSVKDRTGDVIHIAINDRTTIELPANLSPEEIKARVERYIKLRNSNA